MKLPAHVHSFMQTLRDHGHQVYVVGGAVRDILGGKEVTNWDFTTSASPEAVMAIFPDHFYHNTYGTVTVKVPSCKIQDPHNYELFEITPFRRESQYSNKRHPDMIEWATTLQEDLGRRDFTINALATDGEHLIDLYGGQNDFAARTIRAVGDPRVRFGEDALRMLRAVRFSSQLGFLIESSTLAAIQSYAANITHISFERIRDEFFKILAAPHPAEGILFLRSTGLLKHILPELDDCFAIGQKSPKRHHIYDVGTHQVQALKHCKSPHVITRFATLIHDIGKVKTYRKDPESGLVTFFNHEVVGTIQAKAIADRFRLSREDKDLLIRLVEHHQFVVSEELTDNAIRRFIRNVGRENLEEMFALRHADRMGGAASETSWRTELFKKRVAELLIEPFTVKDLKIDGHDVMKELNLKPSRQIGDILDALFEKVVNKEIPNEREPLLLALIQQSR